MSGALSLGFDSFRSRENAGSELFKTFCREAILGRLLRGGAMRGVIVRITSVFRIASKRKCFGKNNFNLSAFLRLSVKR